MKSQKRIFTPEEENLIANMYNNNVTFNEIFKTLHCGSNTLRVYMKEKGLSRRPIQSFSGYANLTKTKFTYDILVDLLNKDNCVLIKPIKLNYKTNEQITILCPMCGKEFDTTIYGYENKIYKTCNSCSALLKWKNQKASIEEILKYFESENYKVIDCADTYQNSQDRFTVECPNGHIYNTTWINFKTGYRCAECDGSKRYEYSEVQSIISNAGSVLLSDNYVNCKENLHIKCRCGNLYYTSFGNFVQATNKNGQHYCKKCKGELSKGDLHFNWKNGISSIDNSLREQIKQWKFDSLKEANFKCCLSGSNKDLVVHHLYGFSTIISDLFDELKLPIYQNLFDYSDSEMQLIIDKCIELHYKHGLGVCLTRDLHKLFHSIYGNRNITPEQFEEFKTNYKQGKLELQEEIS
jgi:hypothetical protein